MKKIEMCDYRYDEGLRGRIDNQLVPTLTAKSGGGLSSRPLVMEDKIRLRFLTPKECWRLMGFDDEDFEKASKVNSESQLYKQAGNSIVVNVLMAIFNQML